MAYVLPAPTGLALDQPSTGDHIRAVWDNVAGATNYFLYRKPHYSGGWVDSFVQIYTGSSATFDDDIQLEGPMNNDDLVTYKVSSYNSAGEGPASSEVSFNWQDF
jgi:hypothetical protein